MHTLCMALLWLPDLLRALFEEEWCNLESPAKRMQSLNTKRVGFLHSWSFISFFTVIGQTKEIPNLDSHVLELSFKLGGVYTFI